MAIPTGKRTPFRPAVSIALPQKVLRGRPHLKWHAAVFQTDWAGRSTLKRRRSSAFLRGIGLFALSARCETRRTLLEGLVEEKEPESGGYNAGTLECRQATGPTKPAVRAEVAVSFLLPKAGDNPVRGAREKKGLSEAKRTDIGKEGHWGTWKETSSEAVPVCQLCLMVDQPGHWG